MIREKLKSQEIISLGKKMPVEVTISNTRQRNNALYCIEYRLNDFCSLYNMDYRQIITFWKKA